MSIKTINEICKSTFGHDILTVDPTAALWVAEAILEKHGVNAYKRISNARNKIGKGTVFPTFESPLFKNL